MNNKNEIPDFKPLSEEEQRVEQNKWNLAKKIMLVIGVASMLGGVYTSVYNIGEFWNIILLIGSGLLIAKARNIL